MGHPHPTPTPGRVANGSHRHVHTHGASARAGARHKGRVLSAPPGRRGPGGGGGVRRWGDPPDVLVAPMLAVAVVGLVANVVAFALLRGGSRESLNVEGAYLE